ncbi:UNVERIFIED_CONTAM: 2-amino-4-hydroxy-6-hydroxymethyldihydropteridine diphosphokinase [Paenibacillus sp. PvR008]
MNAHSTSEASEAYIALGANLGDREHTLYEAITALDEHPGIRVLRCSSLYETEPVGYLDQPSFLNMAAAVSTTLAPEELLAFMLEVESRLGRVRHIPNGPRTIDLDLLWMEAVQLATPDLELPHPRMLERAFVLVPLADIVPDQDDPSGLYSIVHTALKSLDGKDGIQFWKKCSWRNGFAPFGS